VTVTEAGLTLHEPGDEDWFIWEADDDWYDNIDHATVYAGTFPAGTNYGTELYLDQGGTWTPIASDSGSGRLLAEYYGDPGNDSEDRWALRVFVVSWPAGSCAQAYELEITF
jgi:hypothetical protein